MPVPRTIGGVPERTIGAVSKTVVVLWATVGSNPTPSASLSDLYFTLVAAGALARRVLFLFPGTQWCDGAASTATHPVHVYNQAGHYAVALTATAGAESDTEVKVDYITANAAGGATPITRTIVYTYDGLYRLTRAGYSTNESFQYAYDAAGNMTAMTTTLTSTLVTTKSYDAANPVERDELPAHHRHHGRRAPHTGVERRRRTLAGRGRYLSMGRRRAPDPGDGGGGDKPLCLPG
jgi:YD repeat-containing protein